MKQIKIQCPAKINLTLKVIEKRPDGFHNIDSIMQTINLFDYLKIKIQESDRFEIFLDGTSTEIPYDDKNIVFKAVKIFIENTNILPHKIDVFIEKNIPIAAGLAGGSTDAAGVLYGLNKLFGEPLNNIKLHELCAKLGSDLNVCLEGGRLKTSGRGEIFESLPFEELNVSLIKPMSLGISAKEAYTKFSEKIQNLSDYTRERNLYLNDLEWAIIDDYKELQEIKKQYPNAVMSGSGSTYFGIDMNFIAQEGYWVKNGLITISYGVKEV